jgi:uncharacterized protein (TIGR02246 family)
MKSVNAFTGLLATTILALGTFTSAAAADADILRQTQDRADIHALMWSYVRALDTLNENAYVEVFTPDGTFGSGTNSTKGRDALRKMVTDLQKSRAEREAKGEPKQPAMHHIITNAHIEFIDKDHARFHSYWMTVFAGAPNTQPPRVAAAGRGIDEVVRVNGKWLIRSRNVAPQD